MSVNEDADSSMYVNGEYRRRNPGWHVEDSAWKARHVSSLLSDNGESPRSILDIGCGAGHVLSELRQYFPESIMVGWEISPDAAKGWDQIGDEIELNQGDFRSDERKYDVALMLDVFEHVPDYMGFLREASSVADKFVFHIPLEINLSSVLRKRYMYARETIGHLHYFSAESALAVLNDTGYRVLDSRFTGAVKELESSQRRITHVANVLRSAIELAGVQRAAAIMGGYSLLVLAERVD